MINRLKFVNARFPKLVGEVLHSNQFLKMFSIYTLTLLLITLLAFISVVNRSPNVITLNYDGKNIPRSRQPKVEDLVKEGVKAYLEMRYKWEPSSVVENLKEAEHFIMPKTITAFRTAVSKVAKFSIDKSVSQRIYPEKLVINLTKKAVFISGDRITAIQGMKAAGDLNLEIHFEYGDMTESNPWGIYITKEKEE